MKKWEWKKFAVAGLAFALSFQSTAFAGEIVILDDEERVTEAVTNALEETEGQTETQQETESGTEQFTETGAETETNTETATETGTEIESEAEDTKENGMEMHFYTLGEQQEIKETTLEELETLFQEKEGKMSETAVVLYQPKNYWVQDEEPETESEIQTESLDVETVLEGSGEVLLPEETETETKETEVQPEKEIVQKAVLAEEDKEQAAKLADFAENVVVVMNSIVLEDELVFRGQEHVKAVVFMDEKSEESFSEAVKNHDLEKEYADYQKKIDEFLAKEVEKLNTSLGINGVLPGGLFANSLMSAQQGTTPGTDLNKIDNPYINKESETTTPSTNRQTTNQSESPSGSNSSSGTGSGSSTTAKKEISLTLDAPEGLEEDDEDLYVTYEMTCPDDIKISEAVFSLTYDSTKMSYDSDYSDAGDILYDEDTKEGFQYSASDSSGKVIMTLKAGNNTAQTMKGVVLDLGFALKNPAKTGDIFNLKLEVTSLKSGTTELKGNSGYDIKVNESPIQAMAYTDDEQTESTESESQTQTQTQTQTQAQTQQIDLQKAAKTGDNTNIPFWVCLMASSAIICGIIRKKRQSVC